MKPNPFFKENSCFADFGKNERNVIFSRFGEIWAGFKPLQSKIVFLNFVMKFCSRNSDISVDEDIGYNRQPIKFGAIFIQLGMQNKQLNPKSLIIIIFPQNSSKSLKTSPNPSKLFEIPRNFSKSLETSPKSIETSPNLWKLLQIRRNSPNPSKLLQILRNLPYKQISIMYYLLHSHSWKLRKCLTGKILWIFKKKVISNFWQKLIYWKNSPIDLNFSFFGKIWLKNGKCSVLGQNS